MEHPTQAIMQRALGTQWERLGEAVRRHYQLVPGEPDERVMEGQMVVYHSRLAKPLIFAARLFGALVSAEGEGVPVVVRNLTRADSPALHWHRTFAFAGRAPLTFISRMEYLGGNEIVEYVRANLGIRMALSEENGALVYESRGYDWRLGPWTLRIPDWLLLGTARIVERPLGGDRFRVEFAVRHRLWGETFGYHGDFVLRP